MPFKNLDKEYDVGGFNLTYDFTPLSSIKHGTMIDLINDSVKVKR